MSQYTDEEMEVFDQTFDKFERTINNMVFNYQESASLIANRFLRMHRTLQQCTIKLLIACIKVLAEYHTANPNHHDLRNEASVQWLKDAAKLDSYMPFI